MSEAKAESLYGAAPEGDEDPHASQEVPDPGESLSYSGMDPDTLGQTIKIRIPKKFHAAQLDGYHLGLHVKVTDRIGGHPSTIYGTLLKIEHGASLITETPIGRADEELTLGRRWVLLTFSFGGAMVSPEAVVELL